MRATKTTTSTLQILLALVSIVFLSGCFLNQGDIFRRELRDRGPVALSADNPYIAANRLLAREMSSSETLSGFVKLRGTPDAIQVSKPLFNGYQFIFFYLEKEQIYLLEQGSNDWLIQGPERISEQDLTKLVGIAPNRGRAVLPKIEDETKGDKPPKEAPKVVPSDSKETTSKETTLRGKKEFPLAERQTKKKAASETKTPPSDDAPAAEESLSGDVIHTVRYQGETLRIISSWYTGGPENAARIARINGFKNADALRLDQIIRIPRYLLQQTKPLPEEEVQSYLKRLSDR